MSLVHGPSVEPSFHDDPVITLNEYVIRDGKNCPKARLTGDTVHSDQVDAGDISFRLAALNQTSSFDSKVIHEIAPRLQNLILSCATFFYASAESPQVLTCSSFAVSTSLKALLAYSRSL